MNELSQCDLERARLVPRTFFDKMRSAGQSRSVVSDTTLTLKVFLEVAILFAQEHCDVGINTIETDIAISLSLVSCVDPCLGRSN